MAVPKYSVVLPCLNGADTLRTTLPSMLSIDRDDVEWVVSNNRSDDGTEELLRAYSASDDRLRIVTPERRLPAGSNLEFAYAHAQGDWQGHLGDDDVLFPSRFDVLDHLVADTGASVVRGRFVGYWWPEYLDKAKANTLDEARFSGSVQVDAGREMARELLNTNCVPGGGSWVVRREVIEHVRSRCGRFSTPVHVEFFAMRAACALAERVAAIDVPLWVLGRHPHSSGTQALRPKEESDGERWDWSFERPEPWRHCPFSYRGYHAISLDAAMTVKAALPEMLGDVEFRWLYWSYGALAELHTLVDNGQAPPVLLEELGGALCSLPQEAGMHWRLVWPFVKHREPRRLLLLARSLLERAAESVTSVADRTDRLGWDDGLRGDRVGIGCIADVPGWIESRYPSLFRA